MFHQNSGLEREIFFLQNRKFMNKRLLEIINGCLLGDGCIYAKKGKYHYFSYSSKSKEFLEWLKRFFDEFEIHSYISLSNKKTNVYSLGFYINTQKESNELMLLRQKWYIQENGKTRKIVPKDLELTPTTLLFWYLGDGSLIRRKKKDSRVPPIVLATCCFSKEDVDFLIKKLAELGLNFYPVRYKSGFNRGEYCGYCLFSKTQEGTPFKFFKLIGFQPPEEIKYCSLGKKGKFHEEKLVIDKWPNRDDWIKILSNVDSIGEIIKQKRLDAGLSVKQVAEAIGVTPRSVRDVESGRINLSLKNFEKIISFFNFNEVNILEAISEYLNF